jgi:hypothetical protein
LASSTSVWMTLRLVLSKKIGGGAARPEASIQQDSDRPGGAGTVLALRGDCLGLETLSDKDSESLRSGDPAATPATADAKCPAALTRQVYKLQCRPQAI